jgi:hypothetical protein
MSHDSYARLPDPPAHLRTLYLTKMLSDYTLIRAEKWQSIEWKRTPLYQPSFATLVNVPNPHFMQLHKLVAANPPTPRSTLLAFLARFPLIHLPPYDPAAPPPSDPRLATNWSQLINLFP